MTVRRTLGGSGKSCWRPGCSVSRTAVTAFSVATKTSWKNQGGEWQSHTEWDRIAVWGEKFADFAATLKKGALVQVEGPLRSREYERQRSFTQEGLDVWFAKDDRQRVLWPSYIDLSADYFGSLQQHAVPLDEYHIAALSHSGLALDIYVWLAQRLHRIPAGKPVFISWAALHGQFGQGYNREHMTKFRQVFRAALKQVLTLYQAARITEDQRSRPQAILHQGSVMWRQPPAKGITLHHSQPPILRRSSLIR